MSADSGIYILQTKDGFRVAFAQAIDNIYWNPNGIDPNYPDEKGCIDPDYLDLEEIWYVFNSSELFEIEDDACEFAENLEKEIGWTEYGIQFLRYPDIYFPNEPVDTEFKEEEYFQDSCDDSIDYGSGCLEVFDSENDDNATQEEGNNE